MHDVPCVEYFVTLEEALVVLVEGLRSRDFLVYDPTTPCRTLLPYQRRYRALH